MKYHLSLSLMIVCSISPILSPSSNVLETKESNMVGQDKARLNSDENSSCTPPPPNENPE
ncbi:hypothetical protein DB346_10175 [Verrucomicrobia bacterium LW23]|nr:hypothetical protein DB346_10175 [Verrucomicrobia bacterium LW23]